MSSELSTCSRIDVGVPAAAVGMAWQWCRVAVWHVMELSCLTPRFLRLSTFFSKIIDEHISNWQ